MSTNLEVLNNFVNNGYHIYGEIFNKDKCTEILNDIKSNRNFDSNLFLTEEEYNLSKQHFGTNPSKNFSFINNLDISFIENNDELWDKINFMLGDDYEIVIKKIICSVPDNIIPEYIMKKINGINIPNLNAYIRPEFRDITYFRGIDYHQDMIDWPKGRVNLQPENFITIYFYIHDVNIGDSVLNILPRTHKLGASIFPHKIVKNSNGKLIYLNDNNNLIETENLMLTGKTGYCAMWHSCLLHGTKPITNNNNNLRLSLRYLVAKKITNKNICGIDVVNSTITGNLNMDITQFDLDERGIPKFKNNILNNI